MSQPFSLEQLPFLVELLLLFFIVLPIKPPPTIAQTLLLQLYFAPLFMFEQLHLVEPLPQPVIQVIRNQSRQLLVLFLLVVRKRLFH